MELTEKASTSSSGIKRELQVISGIKLFLFFQSNSKNKVRGLEKFVKPGRFAVIAEDEEKLDEKGELEADKSGLFIFERIPPVERFPVFRVPLNGFVIFIVVKFTPKFVEALL